MNTIKGKVKWFSNDKGYGFITSESEVDHYFNIRNVTGATLPQNGDCVEFESKKGSKGYVAEKVAITERGERTNKHSNRDDRITCPNCSRKIVPRIITYRGNAEKSICPFCATTIDKFMGFNWPWLIFLIVMAVIVLSNIN